MLELPAPATWKMLRPELFSQIGFYALVMDCLRCWIRCADLAANLFVERHSAYQVRPATGVIGGRGVPRPGRAKRCRPNTGQACTGDQTVARGVGGIIAVGLANVFDARVVAH